MIIHLGDGQRDMDAVSASFPATRVVQIRGNGDFASFAPYSNLEIIEGKRIYCTHGHWERVKFGLYELKSAARARNAELVLFGHTHVQEYDYDDGLHIFNPGSIADGKYGVVDIGQGGIVCLSMKLRF